MKLSYHAVQQYRLHKLQSALSSDPIVFHMNNKCTKMIDRAKLWVFLIDCSEFRAFVSLSLSIPLFHKNVLTNPNTTSNIKHSAQSVNDKSVVIYFSSLLFYGGHADFFLNGGCSHSLFLLYSWSHEIFNWSYQKFWSSDISVAG